MQDHQLSPLNMLQEIFRNDPWKLLVCCILLNRTTRTQVDKVREILFDMYPDVFAMADANEYVLAGILRPLGFYNRRAKSLIRFSNDWLSKDWTSPLELHGIGLYGDESYRMFVLNEEILNPNDKELQKYLEWKNSLVDEK